MDWFVPLLVAVVAIQWCKRRRTAVQSRHAQQALDGHSSRWGFLPKDRNRNWVAFLDRPFVRRSDIAKDKFFYSDWLVIHDGLIVVANHTGAIDREQRIEVLNGHIMDQLVISALKKGGIDCHHRFESVDGHASRQCYRVLLGDADIVKALGKLCGKFDQP